MRDWLLVVVLAVWLVVELLLPQFVTVRAADSREADDLIADALGGSTSHASSDLPSFDFLRVYGGPSAALADGSLANSAAEFATSARAYAISFGHPSGTHDQEASESLGGRPSEPNASSRPDKLNRHADSATSRIHH